MFLKNLIKEFFNPSLKCQRKGHVWETKKNRYLERPSKSLRSVADEVIYEKQFCIRCKCIKSEVEIYRNDLQGLTLSSEEMLRLNMKGRIWDGEIN